MLKYISRRLIGSIPVVLGVSILTFLMIHALPGDPVEFMFTISQAESPTPEQVEEMRRKLGLDQPLYIQYGKFCLRALQGDLGRSIFHKRPVSELLVENLPSTLELTVAGLIMAILAGGVLGVIAATKQNGFIDTASMLTSLVGVSMPSFWLGLLMILLFSVNLGWLPATGQGSFMQLILPALTLGSSAGATVARLVRSSMLEVLRQEYIVTARSKGLKETRVLTVHALRNALIPVVTIVGLQFGRLMSGTVIIEAVFARKGLGWLTIGAILAKDFPLIQGSLLFTSMMYVIVNLIVDVSYAFIDPRIKYDKG
ncbi:MAG: ABC transporter permease [Candidatus Tectomicrobia bacterium]|nr:ABC transporter permease [Candidatus Tectomicrobia bacterium]